MRKDHLTPVLILLLSACAPSVPQEQYDQAQATIAAAVETISDANQALDDATATLAALNTQTAGLASSLATAQAARSEASSRASRLQASLNLHVCPEALSAMKYSSIADASTILSAFVASQTWSERVQGTFRDSIWTNADSKIHGIRYIDASDHQSYTTYFMVYFTEFGWDQGVFWIDRQCWLERR